MAGAGRDFRPRVRHVDRRNVVLGADAIEIGQDLHPMPLVDRGERLVQQQQPWFGEQRTSERDALLLAALTDATGAATAARPD